MNKLKVVSLVFILVFMNSYNALSQVKKSGVENTIEYFNKRTEAIGLAKSENWQALIPVLESLTQQYQNDGDLFYLLGLSYYQTEQYQYAITALKRTLDCGGTVLSGIPTGSSPSNDIMVKIAKAYAQTGDKENAMLWLRKGFASRYDEKPFVKGDSAFLAFNEDSDFQMLYGNNGQENVTRNEAWAIDIDYFKKRIIELHYSPYHAISKTDFAQSFIDLRARIASLSDEQIVVELMKILGGMGNGHNLIIPTSPKMGALKKLPVQFYQFNEGLFIVDAEDDLKQWIGYKVEMIENTPIEEALQKTNVVNARDNDMQTLWLGPYYLGLPDVLEGLGIIKNTKQVVITLSDAKGKFNKLILNPVAWNFSEFPEIPKLKIEPQPLFLSKRKDPYWFKLLSKYSAIYIQFNAVTQKKEQSLEAFNVELQNQIAQNKIQNLILDLRHNHGGDGSLLPPMLKTLSDFEAMNPKGKIFVIMGRGTFSAGQNLLTSITIYTNPILVGEPSGSKPNHIGDAGWFQLPYSGLMGLISTQFHQDSKSEDNRKWIAPHIPITLSSTDYFAGNDKAMDVIMEVIESSGKENKN